MILEYLTIESNEMISDGIFKTVFDYSSVSSKHVDTDEIKAGQFLSVYPKNPLLTLPRPISICDSCGERLTIVFKAVGKGTEELSRYVPGERVKVMYPLGNGFDLSRAGEKAVIAGGGVGVPPLLLLAKKLKAAGVETDIFLGFENEPILLDEFKALADNVIVSTDTGFYGEKGNVVGLVKKYGKKKGFYYSCGPAPMLKAVCSYLSENRLEGQISLEERMACGFGACIGCAVKIKKDDDWQYLKVCKDGPVFEYGEVLW